jgi:hypothetical protein
MFEKRVLMGTFGNGEQTMTGGCRNLRNELHSCSLRYILSGLENQGEKSMGKVTSWET